MGTKNEIRYCPEGHKLEYCIWSCAVTWCPICHKHFHKIKI